MYSKELEELIDAIVADGKITDKERAVVSKRAEKEGVDLDELEVYLDGKVQNQKGASLLLQDQQAAKKSGQARKKTYKRSLVIIGFCFLALIVSFLFAPSNSMPQVSSSLDKTQILGILKNKAAISSTEIEVRKICHFEDNTPASITHPGTWKMGERECVFPVDIRLTYGIDLNEMSISDIEIDSSFNSTIIVKLPDPKLLQSEYDSEIDQSSILDIKSGFRDKASIGDMQSMAQKTYQDVCNCADSLLAGSIKEYEENTKLVISSMFKNIGIQVNYK